MCHCKSHWQALAAPYFLIKTDLIGDNYRGQTDMRHWPKEFKDQCSFGRKDFTEDFSL